MIDLILDAGLDGVLDTLKLIPFLLITYLLMEYLEARMQNKTKEKLHKAGKWGPLWGAVLGMLPQCGFSAAASNLYAGRVVTIGTLIAIYLSTSDEMLPIMISEAVSPVFIAGVLAVKVVSGMIVGILVDRIFAKAMKIEEHDVDIHHFCEHEHCKCGHGIIRPAIKHTLQISLFVLLVTVALNIVIGLLGTSALADFILNKPIIGELLAGIIGLIPNCAASVVITQLYLEGAMQLGTMIAGLLVGAGVGVLVLFRVNEDKKENFAIVAILYCSGVVIGMLINLIVGIVM
ncbi:MAG: arsenic efflux protein [Lachnospiraceae bacterium]|nr:arsenic efflux protein [Candidatus Colinaster equi]